MVYDNQRYITFVSGLSEHLTFDRDGLVAHDVAQRSIDGKKARNIFFWRPVQ